MLGNHPSHRFIKTKQTFIMKTKFFVIVLALALALMGCSSDKAVDASAKGETATKTVASKDYSIDPSATQLAWSGSKSFSDDAHKGMINIASGTLSAEGGNLTAGESRSEMLYFDSGTPDKKIHIVSELSISGQKDRNPENNVRESFLILP